MEEQFFHPKNIAEAIAILSEAPEKSFMINGGTDAVPALLKETRFDRFVCLNQVQEMREIVLSSDWIRIGGAVTYREILFSKELQKITGLKQALELLGSMAVRSVATPAGNIANGAPAADCTTMLTALQAVLCIEGILGNRQIQLSEYLTQPRSMRLKPTEIIREICIPVDTCRMGSAYVKLARRKAQDIGKVLVGCTIQTNGDICDKVIFGLGALNASVVRAWSMEDVLRGKNMQDAVRTIRSSFPAEISLRKSAFTHYKELVLSAAIEDAFCAAWEDSRRKRCAWE